MEAARESLVNGAVVHAARWLPEAKAGRDNPLDGLVEIFRKKRLAIEPIGHVIKHLNVIGKHLQNRFDVALVECVGESLRQRLDLIHAHSSVPPLWFFRHAPYAGVTVIRRKFCRRAVSK
jgi:hypothetical protein